MRTLLEICQVAVREVGFDAPTSIVGVSDFARQLFALANTTGEDISKRGDWQDLLTEASFTSAATEQQVDLSVTFPYVRKIVDKSMFNRTRGTRVQGPLSPQAWQRVLAVSMTPADSYYRIRGSKILFPGTPTAGESIYFEYVDKRWAKTAAGAAQLRFVADTDVPRIDDEIFILGIRWRMLQKRGLEYGEAFRSYEDAIEERLGNDKPAETLNLNPYCGEDMGLSDGYIPEGSWPTS